MSRHCIPSLALLLSVGPTVLLCTVIKLVFFIVIFIWLCFGSVLKTALITQGYFCYC